MTDAVAAASPPSNRWWTDAWALAVIFHLLGNPVDLFGGSTIAGARLAMLALAALVLAFPEPPIMIGLASVQLGVLLLKLPVVGNHEIILTLTGMIVAVALVVGRDRWFAVAAPGLRILLLVSYSWIAFSKLNHDFLNPVVSCAVVFGDEMGAWIGVAVSEHRWLALLVIYATVAIEMAIPLLLLRRSTRTFAVALALAFHFGLALEPASHVWDFSTTLIPLFLLFAPERFRSDLDERVRSWHSRLPAPAIVVGVVAVFAAMIATIVAGFRWWLVPWTLWLAYGLLVLIGYVRWVVSNRSETSTPAVIGRPRMAVTMVVLLAALNGLMPYLEVRTAGAFNMYSNLQLSSGVSNHLVVRRSLPLRSPVLYSVDLADDDDPLAYYVDSGLVVPDRNLARYRSGGDDRSSALISAAGTTGSIGEADLPEPNRWITKFAALRAVDGAGPVQCLRAWGPAN